MTRIYHPWHLWEDHQHGFYDNMSGSEKEQKLRSVIEMFSQPDKTKEYMQKVVDEWRYSCEHNLSNPSLNRIAYLGQAACCLYAGVPSTVTMEAWSLLTKPQQNEADSIADVILQSWINAQTECQSTD